MKNVSTLGKQISQLYHEADVAAEQAANEARESFYVQIRKLKKQCTHCYDNGNSSVTKMSDGNRYCLVCGERID